MARLQDKRSFKAINFDDADEYLEEGDTRLMLNVRVGYSESGDDGIITNVKGTVSLFSELSFSLPAGTNKCIATCPDDQNNRLIWFNYNSNDNHGIYCYNVDANTIQTIIASSTLNFTDDIIHSVDILDGNLAWVDANRPRAINVANAIAGELGVITIEEQINDAKIVPMYPPVCTTTKETGSDFIKSLKSFQFIYRYVFIDGEKGAWSTVSKLVPTAYRDNHINKITLDVSGCELFTKTPLRNVVEYTEFASRELYTLNFNQFSRVSTTDMITASGIFDYFDTESKTPLDTTTDTSIPYYENPIKAGTVAFQNDRKFYADCTEGYDAFNLSASLSNINVQVIPASGGIPYLSDCDTHINDRYLKPDSEYSYSVEFHDKYGRKSGALDLPDLVIKTQEQLSNDYKANVLQFGLNLATAGSYPSYAEKIEIVRSDNKTVTYFVQGRVNNVQYCTGYDANDDPIYLLVDGQTAGVGFSNDEDTGAIELHIDISNWLLYDTNIAYTFTEGDRLTFLTMGGVTDSNSMPVFKGLKIKELRGDLLIVDYPLAGRTNLNHAMVSQTNITTTFPELGQLVLTRFLVGDNGVALYSRITQYETFTGAEDYAGFPFPYTGLAQMGIPATSNNLYGVSLNYPVSIDSTSVDIFIVGSNGYLLKGNFNPTAGTFGSWVTKTTGTSEDINCIESSFQEHNKTDLIMVGNKGLILKYNLASGIATRQTSGTTENLNHVYREGTGNVLVAVGDNGTILRTTNNGSTWTSISITNCQNLNCVYFRGIDAIAVGDEGLVVHSTDSGVTWIQVGIGTVSNLNSVEGDGTVDVDRFCYIAGDNGFLVRFSMSSNIVNNTYNPGTSKNINFFQTYELSVISVFDLGILVGDLDLLKDVSVPTLTFTDYSSLVSAPYGSLYLNYRAKIEVYSPKTVSGPVIYYETGDAHPVGANYTFNKGKESDGDVFLVKKDFRGTGWTQIGDIVYSMTPDSNNTGGTWDKDLGRPNTVLLYPEKQKRRNIIRYSDKYVQDSRINGLSNFREANYELIPNEFGIIRKITPLESTLLINAEREAATAYIDQTVFKGADGRDVAAVSDQVINNVRKLGGGFGCINPESVASYLGYAYWASSNKNAICRYNNSNGVFPISEYKARTYFESVLKKINQLTVINGGYEPKFRNYLLTMGGYDQGAELVTNGDFSNGLTGWTSYGGWTVIDGKAHYSAESGANLEQLAILTEGVEYEVTFTLSDMNGEGGLSIDNFSISTEYTEDGTYTFIGTALGPDLRFEPFDNVSETFDGAIDNISIRLSTRWDETTIAFQEGLNRWISKYSFSPERYGYVNTDMFSFLNGVLWKHNASSTYNNFHGTQYTSRVNPVFNKEPHSQKSFCSLSLEADKVWSASAITTPEGQETFILSAHFEQINKEWWADVKQDVNTPNMASRDEALFNGDFMESNVLDVMLETQASDIAKLRFVNLYSNINNRTNR